MVLAVGIAVMALSLPPSVGRPGGEEGAWSLNVKCIHSHGCSEMSNAMFKSLLYRIVYFKKYFSSFQCSQRGLCGLVVREDV